MKIREAKSYLLNELLNIVEEGELDEIFIRFAEHITNLSRLEIKLNKEIEIDESDFKSIVARLKDSEPIQYILEQEWFAGLKFLVTKDVLIPRPETEELVQWILSDLKKNIANTIHLIDIGTGSGCIPISIKIKMPSVHMSAMDISSKALSVASKNASIHQTEILFIEDDILNPTQNFSIPFDIIISNPPYITISEKDEMNSRVLNFEPHQALFVTNQDPLQFYKAILLFAQRFLATNGIIYLELNQEFGNETEQLFKEANFTTTLKKDMYGNTRMLKAEKKNLPI